MEITHQDVIDFFNAKKRGIYECTFCGSQHFVVALDVTGAGPGELRIPLFPLPGIIEAGYHAFVGVLCSNCGRADLFHRNYVLRWKGTRGISNA